MTDSQAPDQEAPRRGDSGEDATARDWVGAEDPPAPDEGDATAAEPVAAGPAAKAAKAVKAAKGTKAAKAVKAAKAAKAVKAVKGVKAASAPRKAAAKTAAKAPAKSPVKRKAAKAAPAAADDAAVDEAALDRAALDRAAVEQAAVEETAVDETAVDDAALDAAVVDAGVPGDGSPTGAGPDVDEPTGTSAGADRALADGGLAAGGLADGALGEAALVRGADLPDEDQADDDLPDDDLPDDDLPDEDQADADVSDEDLPDDELRAEVASAEVALDGPFSGSPAGPEVDALSDDAPTDDPSAPAHGDDDAPTDDPTDTSGDALAASPTADPASGTGASPGTSAGPPDSGLVGSRLAGYGATAPAPPAAPDPEPAPEPPRQIVRATGPARRPPLVVQGLWPALLAGGLVAATYVGLLPLAVAVLGIQVFLVLGALALLDAPASGGAFIVATGTTLAADAVVLADDGRVTGLAGVAALGLVAALLHQLLRKARSRVTESLADTLVVIVGSVAAACLLALRQVEGGEEVLLVSLAAAGAVLLAGRIGDRIVPLPVLAVGATRGWPGLLLGLGAGVAAAVLVADLSAPAMATDLPLRSAALLGLVVASTVATADLAVDLGAAELRAGWRDARRVAALRPTALLLPYAVVGPVALLAGRLVLP